MYTWLSYIGKEQIISVSSVSENSEWWIVDDDSHESPIEVSSPTLV